MDGNVLTRASLETVLGKPRELRTKAVTTESDNAVRLRTSFDPLVEGDTTENSDLDDEKRSNISSNITKRYACDVAGCDKSFIKPIFLEMHLRTHTGERPYSCTVDGCGQSYTRSWHLRRHVEKAHKLKANDVDTSRQAERHRCGWESCNKEYNSRDALRKHVARVHEGREHVGRQRPGERLACSHCGASFAKHSRLKAHLFHHTGEMPFRCHHEGCSKEFLLQSKLRAHEKIHVGYECEKCPGVRYPTWSTLRKHFKEKHNVKRCSKCDKTFMRAVHLEAHMATHADEREAFICSVDGCSKSYFELKNLHAHQKAAHQGVRFACILCEKEFRSKQALRRHGRKCSTKPDEKRPVKTGPARKPRKDKGVVRKRAACWLSGWEDPVESERSGYETADVDDPIDEIVRRILLFLVDKVSADDTPEQQQYCQRAQTLQESDTDQQCTTYTCDGRTEDKSTAQPVVQLCSAAVPATDARDIVVINDDDSNEMFDDLEEKSGDAEAVKRMEEIEQQYIDGSVCELGHNQLTNYGEVVECVEISDSDD